MRIAVVGGGIAGALLAWRLRQVSVDVYLSPTSTDASAVSGGMVRGFERSLGACRRAAGSLAELRADPVLRAAAAYREIGSVYLLPPGTDPTGPVRVVEEWLPGSATVLTNTEYPLAPGATAVVERHAGYLSPAGLRAAALAWAAEAGATIRAIPVARLDPSPAVRLVDGTIRGYDAVIVAAGAWTPALLGTSDLPTDGLRTKQIQYSVYWGQLPGLGAFVDDITGLYGRPAGDGEFLLGLPGDRWDVDPAALAPDTDLVERVTERAGDLLGASRPLWTRVSADCYHDSPGLVLREVKDALFTFTGGSGGAAKSVLAASRVAAAALLG